MAVTLRPLQPCLNILLREPVPAAARSCLRASFAKLPIQCRIKHGLLVQSGKRRAAWHCLATLSPDAAPDTETDRVLGLARKAIQQTFTPNSVVRGRRCKWTRCWLVGASFRPWKSLNGDYVQAKVLAGRRKWPWIPHGHGNCLAVNTETRWCLPGNRLGKRAQILLGLQCWCKTNQLGGARDSPCKAKLVVWAVFYLRHNNLMCDRWMTQAFQNNCS